MKRPTESILERNIVVRVVVYYLALGAVLTMAWQWIPPTTLMDLGWSSAISDMMRGGGTGAVAELSGGPGALVSAALAAMVLSILLAFPVAWVYTLTRQKAGYLQSVVQLLVILPPVVAGIVVMVKYSLALAFSLAGIVAAVRFRNTLEDSKDAVYVFLATGLGLAAGFAPGVAIVLSVLFNALILLLWWTDFGRTPARLEGRMAEDRMERLLELANRTGEFVARMDDEILSDMAPQQLEAIADRAYRRRRQVSTDVPQAQPTQQYGAILRIRTAEAEGVRLVAESIFEPHLKRWRYGGSRAEDDGTRTIEYAIQLRRTATPESLLTALRAQGPPHVISAEMI
jgi:hypothetical protein